LIDAGREAPDEIVRDLVQRKRPHYMRRVLAEQRLFPGAADLVRRAAGFGPVGVVSGALRDEIELGLDRLGVRDLISFVISAEACTRSKPDPEGYLLGLAALGKHLGHPDPARVLVIEDSAFGVRAAKLAGMACLALTHSAPRPVLEAAGADRVSDDINEIDTVFFEALYRMLHGD
jgi:HAD superfamily hydrolase (TIGR01509 family)